MAIGQAFIDELKLESVSTRRMLERAPEASLTWKPHAKSRTLGEIASHIANIPGIFLASLGADGIDRETYTESAPVDDVSAIVGAFDRNMTAALEGIAGVPDDSWMKPWTYRYGAKVIIQLPRVAVARAMGINHLIHHRGQLSVYLRLLEVSLPAVYGPTADEAM